VRSLNFNWRTQNTASGKLQFIGTLTNAGVGRLFSDLIFFPNTVVKMIPQYVRTTAALQVETFLKSFTTQPRKTFDVAFANVYAKMLEVGITYPLTTFVETSVPIANCAP
jgi:hypothetical protein